MHEHVGLNRSADDAQAKGKVASCPRAQVSHRSFKAVRNGHEVIFSSCRLCGPVLVGIAAVGPETGQLLGSNARFREPRTDRSSPKGR